MNMLFVLTIIAAILGIIFKRNKLVSIYICIILWILVGWQYNTADYYNYGVMFRQIASFSGSAFAQEPLFYLLNYVVFHLNGSMQHVYIIGGAFAIVVLYIAISRFTNEQNYALSLLLISSYLLYAVQIRNFIALPFVILAIDSLTENHKNYLKFFVYIAVATGFHMSSLFYLLLVFLPKMKKKTLIIYTIAVGILGYIVIVPVMNFFQSGRSIVYRLFSNDTYTIVIYDIFVLIGIAMVAIEYFMLKHDHKHGYDIGDNLWNNIDFIMKVNIFMLIMIPLQSVSIEFVRLYRNILVLDFIACSYSIQLYFNGKIYSVIYKQQVKHILWNIGLIAYAITYGNLYIYRQCYETVFLPIFNNNILMR